MRHGPIYRSATPDLDKARALRRFGPHKGDQAVPIRRKGNLSGLIFLALMAVTCMVWTQNMTLPGLMRAIKNLLVEQGCTAAQDVAASKSSDAKHQAAHTYRQRACG